MPILDLAQFDPLPAELQKAVEATRGITATDLKDKAQLKVVKQNRITLRNFRVAITKKGKEIREDAVQFQRDVLTRERELVAIIEPEEDRLAAIEAEAEKIALREKNRDKLPWRREVLAGFQELVPVQYTDDQLLDMDDDKFSVVQNDLTVRKNQAESDRLAEERRKIDAEKAAIDRQKEIDAAKAQAAQEERDRVAREEQDRKTREEREKKEADERAQREKDELELRQRREKEDAERREAEEAERLERNKRYGKFRAECGWTEETKGEFREEKAGNTIVMWKRLGVFTIK